MIILSVIVIICGVISYNYETQLNNDVNLVLENLFSNGTTTPGTSYITVESCLL